MIEITGAVEKIIYQNKDNGFCVFQLETERGTKTISGTFFNINKEEYLKIYGNEEKHPKYGMQIKADHFESVMPQNLQALISYLSKGIIKGIGPVKAKKIVNTFGKNTLYIMEHQPERLAEIDGIGLRSAQLIGERVAEKTAMQKVLFQLADYGIPMKTGIRMYRFYKEKLFHVLQRNPYQMIDDIAGVGFETMDKIAIANGVPFNSTYRVQSGIKYVLDLSEKSGHMFLPYTTLVKNAQKLLETDNVESILVQMIEDKALIRLLRGEYDAVYRTNNYYMEQNVADKLITLSRKVKCSKKALSALDSTLDEVQTAAVKTAAENGLMVLTGGPGVGKTTTTNLILQYFKIARKKVKLAAPTGRAAKRMQEATGMSASTIHRLLGIEGKEFIHNESNPLVCDAVIIDETSMLDMPLMNALLKAIPNNAQLILVGDKNQLPSVGKGNVLSDIIESGVCPVVELKKIYRQAKDSEIIYNAHQILAGGNLKISNKDFFFKSCEDPEEIKQLLVHYVADSLPDYTKESEIQVLTPTRKRELGVENLNNLLQNRLNPNGLSIGKFRQGDKVIQMRNNYEKERIYKDKKENGVFNGDAGTIFRIDEENEYVYVKFEDGAIVQYKYSEMEELDLAYALTIHKSQGSEYPVVVIPVYDYIPMLTTMNLLYTAVTRARKYILLIGSPQRMYRIIHNYRKNMRYTALDIALKSQEVIEK